MTNTDEWIAKHGLNGATINNTYNADKTLQYFIAKSYANGGTNNKFFTNDNIYGFYAKGSDVTYSQCPADILTNGAYGISSDKLRELKLKSVWVGQEKLVSGTDYYWQDGNDVLAISSEKFALGETENQKVYYVTVRTADGADYSWPIMVKRVGGEEEQAPDLSNVTLPAEDGWTQVTDGAAINGSKYYYPTNGVVSNIAQFKDLGSQISYGGAEANTVNAPAFGFSVNTGDNPESVWVGTKKLSSDASYVNTNVVTVAQSEFDLGDKEEDIFYVTLRYSDKDVTIPIKVVALGKIDTAAINDWVEFDVRDNKSNESIYGTKYYVSREKLATISKNTGVSGTYDGTNRVPQWNWDNNVSVYGEPVLGWICENGTKGVEVDGKFLTANSKECAFGGNWVYINQSVFALNAGEAERIFIIRLYGNSDDEYFAMKVVNPNVEETTTPGGITPTTEPTDAEWTLFRNSNTYYYYVPAGNEEVFKIADNQLIEEQTGLYFGMQQRPDSIKVNGVSVENLMADGAQMRLSYDNFSQNGAYQVTFTANNKEYTVWIKKETPKDYKPTGVLATSDATAKTATVKWTPSADAIAAGCTYTVQIANLEPVAVVGAEATVDITSLTFGSYDVTVNAVDASGNVLGSTKIQFEYKDPDKVDSNLSTQYQWEGRRRERLSWDKVDNATGYAIYTDGKLFETTTDLNMDVYAYAFANAENTNGQKTTVGNHTTKVVALFDGEEAPAYDQINEKHVIGENSFDLYVNYIFGRYTDIWNTHAEKSLWAFTICESGDAPATDKGKVVKGADAKVIYNDDGSANVTINDVGKHSSFQSMDNAGDQAWTIKTASYDAPVTKDQLVNLSYDITGPASLVGQEIRIKVCAEETDENGVYINDEYLNKYYTFVDDGNGGAVIHFTETFTSTNDTYDMFFGLGLLQNPDDENKTPIELTVEEAEAKDIYGVHSVTASPVHQRTEETNLEGNHTTHGIMVQWETDVPYRLRKEYTYEVYIDGIKTTEGYLNGEAVSPDDARSGATWYDYECGPEPGKEHKVEVVSYYNGTETARVETNVFVRNRTYPDLIISNVVVQNNDTKEYYTGDSVPVDVTIKNISAIDAVAADGEIAVHLYLRKPDGTLTGQKAWFVVDSKDENGKKILKAGEEVTKTMYYTVNPEDAGANWRYTFVARADADGKVDEGRYEDNNDFARTFIFLATPDPVTFNNDGTNVSISWPGVEMAHHYLINYVSNGETKSIETRNNNTSYVLNDVLDNNSTVEVYSVRSNGAQVIRAEGTALADLTITDIGPVGVATVNKPVNFKGTIKNVGAARATSGNNEKIIALTISGSDGVSDWSSYASVSDGLAPNETVDITVGGNYTPKTEGKFTLTGNVNDSGRIPEVDRKAGPVDTENNNNRKAFDINVVPSGTLNLINVDGNVYADFTLDTENTIQMYAVTYTSNGVEKTDYVAPEDVITGNRIALNAPLDNLSTVSIAARYTADDEYFTFATDTAKVDLTVSKIEIVNENGETLTENFKVNTFEEFYARTYITNIGTAQVKAYHSDSWEEEYANAIFVTARDADGKVLQGNQQDAIEQYNEGLTVGATATVDVGTIQLSKQGKQTINVKVDDPGWDVEGYITESNEENNTMSVELDVNLVQQPMDWTPLYDSTDLSKIYDFEVANSSLKRSIEYKVLDTSYTDIDYKDLVTKATGYNAFYMSIGFEDNHKIVNVNQETGKMAWSYTNTWFQQVEKSYLVDQNGNATGNVQVIDNEYLSRIHSQGCDIYGYDGKFFENTAQTQLGYAGNGFNFNVNSFAPGKYYMMTIVDYDPDSTDDAGNMKMRNYVTLAFRVTTELEGWTHVGASDATDINKLAAFYHDSDHQVDARFYYDCSDLGLACIKAYNGTHFTLTTDTAKKLNDDVNKTKIEIAYGVYDEAANKVVAPENWDTVCVNPGIYGKEGTNNLQIDIASLMRKLPLHSAKGGQTDYEYYFLKVYYDTESEPDSFIPVPMMVATEIPKIIPVQGLEVTNRGSLMTVNWTATNAQVADGYLYDIYIDGNLAKENVQAGSYNFAGSGNIGEQHKIVVKAKWCEQEALAEVDYVMKEPETEPVETIPSEKPTYPPANDHKWVLINGQNILPIGEKGMFEDQTVNAQIWYYTDDDINSVIGYNDYYISLNGSDKYFTGQSTKIYVQNGDSTTFESKTVYDSYYKGQTQMNAARMFQTYGEWQKGDTLYYTVRVAGNNGNTYKDFYFKVIPKDASPSITTTGDWRNISGEYKLPVKMGENSELQGTVRFLDCPLPTNKYTTGTNTYDIIGYNGYYMSIIGDTHYYTGENTKIYVSQAKDTVQYAENAANLTFTEKTIYDKVYPGQIIIKCAETFTVEYATTYYLLKVESGDQVTYIPVEIKVNTGDVEVLGFQMNTNHNAGGVAEHSPSFRVVSKTSKVMTIGNKLYEVKKMGTVYAAADVVDDDTLRQNMTLVGVENNDYIQSYETTQKGTLQGYTTTESDSKYNTYFALTFKFNDYMYHTIEQNYAVRAYAVLDDGTPEGKVVYGHNVYKTNMYEIAQNLYESQKMGTKDAHDFLYNNILNLVDLNNHRTQIANAMFKALEIRTSSDSRYKTINTMTKDIYDYAKCQNGYTYKDREQFRCSEVEDELLQLLNGVSGNEKTYTSVYDWIYTEVPKYGKKDGTKYQGCYRVVEYGWDNTIDKDFYTE